MHESPIDEQIEKSSEGGGEKICLQAPTAFFMAERERLRSTRPLGPVLDVACGPGRHALAAAELGLPTIAVDRNAKALAFLEMKKERLPILCVRADLEANGTLPVARDSCGAILVFCFLHRPLAPAIVEALAPGGLLLYQTFTEKQQSLAYGPKNPAFLLREQELPRLFAALDVIAYHEGLDASASRPRHVAQLIAQKRKIA